MRQQVCIVFGLAGGLLLASCGISTYQGRHYTYPNDETPRVIHNVDASEVILGDCDGKTLDNEGCAMTAALKDRKGNLIALGDWWLVKAYGAPHIKIMWHGNKSMASIDYEELIRAEDFVKR